ncbi:ATP-binding protein [Kitasatospora sp. NPDC002227]|uniref:ATP-binding protein n=1 Tax=Kitasatospora sp. NPDC002227 TaxID=3154773 RepID=UPI00331883B0
MPVHSSTTVLIRDPASVPRARLWVNTQITDWGVYLDDATRDAIAVVFTELATNAVRHTKGAMLIIHMYVHPRLRQLRVEVYDGSPALPRPRLVGPDEASGRGMFLVEQLAKSHGAERTECGKKVWAELALPEQPMTHRQFLVRPRRAARQLARRGWPRRRPPIRPHRPRRPSARLSPAVARTS